GRVFAARGGSLLFHSSPGEDFPQAGVSFVTGVPQARSHRLRPRYFRGPRLRLRRRVVYGELISNRILVDSGETFGQHHVFAGSLERILSVEITRFHDQRVALPVAPVTTSPLTDLLRQM